MNKVMTIFYNDNSQKSFDFSQYNVQIELSTMQPGESIYVNIYNVDLNILNEMQSTSLNSVKYCQFGEYTINQPSIYIYDNSIRMKGV